MTATKRPGWRRFLVGCAVLLWGTAVLAACSGQNDHLIVARYSFDEDSGQMLADLFLLRSGEDEEEWRPLGEELPVGMRFFPDQPHPAFFPSENRDFILFSHGDREETVFEIMPVDGDGPEEIYEFDGDFMNPFLLTDPFRLFFVEFDGREMRCYLSVDGQEAERIARTSRCDFYDSGFLLVDNDDGEITATLLDETGAEIGVFLDEEEDVRPLKASPEREQLLYLTVDDDEVQLFSIGLDGETVEISDELSRIYSAGFLNDDIIFYIGQENEEDPPAIYLSNDDDPLLENVDVSRPFYSDEAGNIPFYGEDEEEQMLYLLGAETGDVTDVAEGEEIGNVRYVGEESSRLLFTAVSGDEWALYSAAGDGADVVELVTLDTDAEELQNFFLIEQEEAVLVQFRDEDGDRIYYTPIATADGFILLEDWWRLILLTAGEDRLIFSGTEDEGDDPILYSISLAEDAAAIELDDDIDDDQRIVNAFLSADGRDVLYSVHNFFDRDPDQSEVRQVPLDGESGPETILEEVELVDVQWETSDLIPVFRRP